MPVYFMYGEDTGLVKIGFADNPVSRLRDLQTGSAESLLLTRVLPGGKRKEAELHRYFAYLRVRGEWFKPDRFLAGFANVPVHEDFSGHRKQPEPAVNYRPFRYLESVIYEAIVASGPEPLSAETIARRTYLEVPIVEMHIRWMRKRYGKKLITVVYGEDRVKPTFCIPDDSAERRALKRRVALAA